VELDHVVPRLPVGYSQDDVGVESA